MRSITITAAALLVILTGAASAGLPTTPNQPGALAQNTAQAPGREPAINPLTKGDISSVEGTGVYGDDGKLGYVSTALLDPKTKKIDRLVVSAGGVLGIGGHRVAIPIDQFRWDADKGVLKLSTTMASLKAMPAWVEGGETATGSSQPPSTEKSSTGAGDAGKAAR